jgi:hypothetical protein
VQQRDEAALALKIMPHGRLQEWVAEEKLRNLFPEPVFPVRYEEVSLA